MSSSRTAPPAAASQDDLLAALGETHAAMIAAVQHGGGLERVAALAADAVAGPIAIVIPSYRDALAAEALSGSVDLEALRAWVGERLRGRPSIVPVEVIVEAPIRVRDEIVGVVALLRGAAPPRSHASEYLRLAASATVMQLAIEGAREEAESKLRGSLLEELRSSSELDGPEIVRRAARLGCDLSRGATIVCAELTVDRPRVVLAMIEAEFPGALAQELARLGAEARRRIYTALPASAAGEHPAAAVVARAQRLATRLEPYGTVGSSGFHPCPSDLGRALREAEFMLEVNQQCQAPIAEDVSGSIYKLLFRMLDAQPQELRDFHGRTVAAIAAYDDGNRTELVRTLRAYLHANCNMNATASDLFAHRHTVAYRLDRIRELTGLDPTVCEDREALGLGLKVHRLLAARAAR